MDGVKEPRATREVSSADYLRALAVAFDPVEGAVHFEPDAWLRIRNAIFDVVGTRSETETTVDMHGGQHSLPSAVAEPRLISQRLRAEVERPSGNPVRVKALLTEAAEALERHLLNRLDEELRSSVAEKNIIRNNPDGTLDEVFCAPCQFHIEQMDGGHWWIGVLVGDGVFHHINLHSKGKIKAMLETEHHQGERVVVYHQPRRSEMLNRLTGAGEAQQRQSASKDRAYTTGPSIPPQPMSEVQYAAQEADDALRLLEKAVHELVARLEPVLTQEPPQPVGAEGKAQRAVSSRMATALYQHAMQTENLTRIVHGALNRLAL